MSFITDNSIVMAWCMPDEHTPELLLLLQAARSTQLFVPSIWPLEVANSLGQALRKGRISSDMFQAALDLLADLDFRVAPPLAAGDIMLVTRLMREHSLTSYDLSYLLLALETGLPLASLDYELVAAARSAGVVLLL